MDKIERHKEICRKLTELYEQKNHDYGDSYAILRKEHPDSILIRIFDKYQRLKTLKKDAAAVKSESIIDTLLDCSNYCIMEIIEILEAKND